MGGVSAGVPPGQHAPQRGLSSVSGAAPRDEEGQGGWMYLDPEVEARDGGDAQCPY